MTRPKVAKTPEERRGYKARLWQRPEGAAFDVEAICAALDKEPWEEADQDSYGQVRQIWLGTVFGVTPSGKVYAPFACSNVAGCASCQGRGFVYTVKRRVAKRRQAKNAKSRSRYMKPGPLYVHRDRRDRKHAQRMRLYRLANASTRSCTACGGMGSREAHLDELWQEHHEKLFEDYGLSFECGGDGDYFAAEYRDAPDEEDES